MSGRRIDLSATQVIASLLAAVTGAIAASYTGVAGTVIGVAVMSVASTAGAAVYQHYLGRSKERLRSAAVVIAPMATFNGTAGHRARRGAAEPASAPGEPASAPGGQARVAGQPASGAAEPADAAAQPGFAAGQLSGWPWSPDSPVTDAFPAVSSGENAGWSTSPAETARRHDSQGAGQAELTDEMRTGPGAGADPGGQGAGVSREPTGPAGPDQRGPATSADRAPAGPAGRRNARRRWPVMAVGAFGVFVFALGGITAFEVAAGKPLDALIWGRNSGGTTVGDITRVQRAEPALRTRPHRAAPSPAHRTTGQPTPTPSPSSATPTPTATRSPSPSPSPARSSPAAATPSPSGSA